MARVRFTPNLRRHIGCPPGDAPGSCVREGLDSVFAAHPRARGYVLDEAGAVRRHMTIFLDGSPIRDRQRLSDPVADASHIDVFQALIRSSPRGTPAPFTAPAHPG